MQTVLDLYKVEIASIPNTHDRQSARRYWLRAVIETLHERAMTASAAPVRKNRKDNQNSITVKGETYWFDETVSVERNLAFWRGQPDIDLFELLDYLTPYFKRAENRGQPLR